MILLLETHPIGHIYLSMSFSHQDLYICKIGKIFKTAKPVNLDF